MKELLKKIAGLSISLVAKDGQLEIYDPGRALTEELLVSIKANKHNLLTLLKNVSVGKHNSIPLAESKAYYNLSSAQKRLYFLYELEKTSTAYNIPNIVKLSGDVDKDKLNNVFKNLISRHEILHTSFQVIDGKVMQKISALTDFEIEYFNATRKEVQSLIKRFIRPFDLSLAPLVRVGLIETGYREHVLMVDMHHIISDGVSQGILIKEFMALYNNNELPPITLQYKDYAEWQQSDGQREVASSYKKFWMSEFSQEVTTLELPTDFLRPKVKVYNGDSIEFDINEENTSRLKSIAETEGATMFMVLLSVYNILLSKLADQTDIIIGTPISDRQHPDLGTIMGMFVNTLPIRNYVNKESRYREFLKEVNVKTISCFANQSFQYEEIIDELKFERNPGHNPLFDVMFSYENFGGPEFAIPGLLIQPYENKHTVSKFDLTLTAMEKNQRIFLNFEYDTDLFRKETIERFITSFIKIISTVVSNPNIRLSDISLLTDRERHQILNVFNNTYVDYPEERTIVDLFEEQVARTPHHVALISEEKRITYHELNIASNRLAHYLRRTCRINPSDVIGVMLNKSEKLIISILAILKAGAAYVPIDSKYPETRIRLLIENSGLKGIIREDECENGIEWGNIISLSEIHDILSYESDANPEKILSTDDLVYVIYTSGSTGIPKGVKVKHNSFVNLINWYKKLLRLSKLDSVLLMAPIGFDLAQKNIFAPLIQGASLCLSEKLHLDYRATAQTIWQHGITVINIAPSAFYPLLETDVNENYHKLKSLKQVVLGGEPIRMKELSNWQKSEFCKAKVINSYGPTECTDVVSYYEIQPEDLAETERRVPIGKAVDNIKLYILNSDLNLMPVGVPGEIYIGGIGVSKGYINNDNLTTEKFIKNPFDQGLMYKTGDLGSWLSDGNIDFIGRRDYQAKIRGIRIELSEIESQLLTHALIKEAVVLVKEQRAEKYLVAYYVSEEKIDAVELRKFLTGALPDYMVPSHYVHLKNPPLTPNGKLNRKALPDPEIKLEKKRTGRLSGTQKELIKIWCEVLGLESPNAIGTDINFFDIGGNSLRLVTLVSKVNQKFNAAISIATMFELPTIALCAEYIDNTLPNKPSDKGEILSEPMGEILQSFNTINEQ